MQAETGAGLGRLEALLDEYANADGLDPARRDRLRASIAEEADSVGLGETLGLAGAEDPLARIDAFVCDVKDSQFGEGLHVFGRGEQGAAERAGLLAGWPESAFRRDLRVRPIAGVPMCCPRAAISTPSIRAPCRAGPRKRRA